MRSIKCLIAVLISTILFTACRKEETPGAVLTLERNALYFSSWSVGMEGAQTISYVASGAQSVAISSYSDGWSAMVNQATSTITVWPIGAVEEGITEDDLPKEGSVIVNALNSEGQATSYSIYVYIASSESLDGNGTELANCYVVTAPSISYTFDATHRPDKELLDTHSVKLLWQSNPGVVKNVNLVDGKAQFYVTKTANDGDAMEDTNAVIAACNASGEVVWSWHLWIVNENPLDATDTYSNGKVFMQKNLGAFTNSNGSTDTDEILDSYGMYYQWGRKDPFPRPYYHDASGSDDESRYNANGTYIAEKYLKRTSGNGTVAYTIKNPMRFIYNDESSEYNEDIGNGVGDWLTTGDDALWSETEKSVYDPCPYGWRVPTADDMTVLTLSDTTQATPYETARAQFGWHLSDGVSTFFYPACGRRRYLSGRVDNMNHSEDPNKQPQPWEGHYWTASTTDNGLANSLYFDLESPSRANKFIKQKPRFRANGLQIRCVKE